MRMRKIAIAISLLISFSLILPTSSASSAQVGKKCKKVGRTITSSGEKLVCKKQGKKRVWTIAVSIKPSPSTSATSSQDSGAKSFTKSEVAARNTTSNCWTIIGNKVYDLTNWVSRHPGGSSAIASICGIDGSNRFKNQHGMSGRANSELDRYYIGDLK